MTYTFVINSPNRISGTRNAGSYHVNFRVLPENVKYFKVHFSFYTSPSYYFDHIGSGNEQINMLGAGYITADFNYAKSMQSDNSPTNVLGNWTRQVDSNPIVGGGSITCSCYLQAMNGTTNVPRIILRPQSETLYIEFITLFDSSLVTDTFANGLKLPDMTNWTMTLNLEPIYDDFD